MTVTLTHLYSYKGAENQHTTQDLYILVIQDVKNDTEVNQILQISSNESSTSSKYGFVLDILVILFMLGN